MFSQLISFWSADDYQLDSLKNWHAALVKEKIKDRRFALKYGEHHYASLEKLHLTMQDTVDSLTGSLTTLRADNTRHIKKIDQKFKEIEYLAKKHREKEEELRQLDAKYGLLESQMEEARREVSSSKEVSAQYFSLGEQSIKEGVELTWPE